MVPSEMAGATTNLCVLSGMMGDRPVENSSERTGKANLTEGKDGGFASTPRLFFRLVREPLSREGRELLSEQLPIKRDNRLRRGDSKRKNRCVGVGSVSVVVDK